MKNVFEKMPEEGLEAEQPEEERSGDNNPDRIEQNLEQEQAEVKRQESLERTRKEIGETSEEQESDSKKAEVGEVKRLDADEFFQKAKVTEEEGEMKRPSPISRDSEPLNNLGVSKEIRNRIAERKVAEVITALTEIYGDLKDVKEKFEIIVDIGAGWGENTKLLAEELGAEQVIGVDADTVPSKKVEKKMGDKLAWVVGDALETMKKIESGSVDLTTAFAFLQVLDKSGKIEMLREMGRIAQEGIVIVDELKRDGLGGLKDLVQNRLSNLFKGEFNVLEEDEWKEIFEKAGLVLEAFSKFGSNDFVAVLKKVENTEEVE